MTEAQWKDIELKCPHCRCETHLEVEETQEGLYSAICECCERAYTVEFGDHIQIKQILTNNLLKDAY